MSPCKLEEGTGSQYTIPDESVPLQNEGVRTNGGGGRKPVKSGTETNDGDNLWEGGRCRGRASQQSILLGQHSQHPSACLPIPFSRVSFPCHCIPNTPRPTKRARETHVEVLGSRVISAVHDRSDGETEGHSELVSGGLGCRRRGGWLAGRTLCCWSRPGPAQGPGLILPDHQLRLSLSPASPPPHRPSTALRPGRFVNREEVETHAWTSGRDGKELSMGFGRGWLVRDRREDKDEASSEDRGDRNEIDRSE